AMSSSGLVPDSRDSARWRQVSGSSAKAPLAGRTDPRPPMRSPFQVALALLSTAMWLLLAVLVASSVTNAHGLSNCPIDGRRRPIHTAPAGRPANENRHPISGQGSELRRPVA